MKFFTLTRWKVLFMLFLLIPCYLLVVHFGALCSPSYGASFPVIDEQHPPMLIGDNYSRPCSFVSDLLTLEISHYVLIVMIPFFSYLLACVVATFIEPFFKQKKTKKRKK